MDEQSLFIAALEYDDPAERARFLDDACRGVPALRERIERLLELRQQTAGFLSAPPFAATQEFAEPPEAPGMRIGRYKLLERIGEGGMGIVYMAEQVEPVRRKVALKIIKPGMDTAQVIARFEAERQALALMDHPNIARVLDGGTTGQGGQALQPDHNALRPGSQALQPDDNVPRPATQAFPPDDDAVPHPSQPGNADLRFGRPFVMELVRGIPITEFCDRARLSVRERLGLFVSVCRAVQHAHQKGIIHRDLKPTNVLVTRHDGTPVPKVIDFGLAKALSGQPLTERTLFTQFAQIVGTPLYMSPEQAALSTPDIDTRSDVYSLGVLLYELLTGTTPFERERLRAAGPDEIRRMIRETEPPRPSARLSTLNAKNQSTIADSRSTDPRRLGQFVRGELDWIVMKALEKDRTRRYETATAFAMDVERYLNDEPVEACPPSTAYRLRKLVRRYQRVVATAVLIVAMLLVGTAIATWQAIRAGKAESLAESRFEAERQARAAADAAARAADQAAQNERTAREQADQAAQQEQAAKQEAEQRTAETRRLLSHSYVAAGATHLREENFARSLPWFVEALRVDAGDEQLESIHRTRIGMVLQQCPKLVAMLDSRIPLQLHSYFHALWADFDALDRPVACRISGNLAQVYDVLNGQPLGPPLDADAPIYGAQLSPDGRTVVLGDDGGYSVWRVESGRRILTVPVEEDVRNSFCFSPDGLLLAMVPPAPASVVVWETETGRVLTSFSLDSLDSSVQGSWPSVPSISRDGRTLIWFIMSTEPPLVCVWTAANGLRTASLTQHSRFLNDLQLSHDGTRFVTASFDTTARVWDADTLAPITPPLEHDDSIQAAWFSPDDTLLVTVSVDHTARLWDVATGQPLTSPLRHDGEVVNAAFSRDGRYVATASWDTTARIWDTRTGRPAAPALIHHAQVQRVAFGSNARHLMSVTTDGIVHVWDLAGAHPPGIVLDELAAGLSVEFTSGGKQVLTTGLAARMWDVETGEPVGPALAHDGEMIHSAVVSPAGRRIATLNCWGSVRLWDAETFAPITSLLQHDWEARPTSYGKSHPSFGPDGEYVLACFRPVVRVGDVQVWKVANGKPVQWPVTQIDNVLSATFSPDGRYIATGRAVSGSIYLKGGSVELWVGRDGSPLHRPIPHEEPVQLVRFSPDSRRLASMAGRLHGDVGEVRVWDVASGERVGPTIRQPVQFLSIDLNADGSQVVTAARDGRAQVWDVASGEPMTPPMEHKERLRSGRFSPEGRFVLTSTGPDNLASRAPAGVRLWDAATGQTVTPPLRHSDPLQHVYDSSSSPDGSRIASVNGDRTTRIWTVAAEQRPLEDVVLLSQVLSSRRLDSVSSLAPISADEKLSAWKDLRTRYPDWFTPTPQQVLAWRHREAVHCMKTGRFSEALAHLTELMEAMPSANIGLRLRRGECALELGEWAIAAEDLQALVAVRDNWRTRYEAALAALGANDHPRYRELCVGLLDRYAETDDSNAANFVVWTLALAPGALDDYAPAVALARRALALKPDDRHLMNTLGAILLRAGDYDAAQEQLAAAESAAASPTGSTAYDAFLLAIAHHHLGRPQEARTWLGTAEERAEDALGHSPAWNHRLTLELLRQEAANLIGQGSGQPEIAANEPEDESAPVAAPDPVATGTTDDD